MEKGEWRDPDFPEDRTSASPGILQETDIAVVVGRYSVALSTLYYHHLFITPGKHRPTIRRSSPKSSVKLSTYLSIYTVASSTYL